MAGSTTNEDILQGINQVVKAINDLEITIQVTGGSGSGGYCGCSIPEDTIIDPPPATPPGDPETDPPPDGWDTWGEYNAYKCRAANKIADDLISTCGNLSSIPGMVAGMGSGLLYLVIAAAFAGSGPAAVATGLIALGVASATGIALVVTGLIILIGLSFGALAYFTTLAGTLSEQKEEVVCALYESDSVEDARIGLLGQIDLAIVGIDGITEPISDAMNNIVASMLGTAVFNTLFEPNESVAEYVGTIDCDVCGPPFCEFFFDSDLGDWEQLASYRDISWSSSDGGVMILDGEGGGGPNWSAAKLSKENLAACLGVETTDLILSRLSWEIEHKIFNTTYNTTMFVQAKTTEDGYHTFEDYFNNVDYEIITHNYPEVEDLLEEFQIFSGNSGIGSGNEFIMWITRIKIFYTA